MIIDEEGCFMLKGKKESDHNTILIETNINKKYQRKEKMKIHLKPDNNVFMKINMDCQRSRLWDFFLLNL